MNMSNNEQSYTVSVVIPAYNAQRYVGRAIDSALAQTRRPDEIIVVDDGSTDNTAEVIRSYGSKVCFIGQENGGASVARNTGIEAARSEWIAFLDADDEWLPEKLQLQIEHLMRNPDLKWSCGNYYTSSPDKQERRLTFTPDRYADLLTCDEVFGNYLNACARGVCARTSTVIVRKDLLLRAGLFLVGQLWAQDMDMFLRIAYRSSKIGFVCAPLSVYYHGVPDSITQTNLGFVEQRISLIDRHLAISEEFGRADDFKLCASNMLESWVRAAVHKKRPRDAYRFVRKFPTLLAAPLRAEVRLRAISPGFFGFCLDGYFRCKRFFSRFHHNIRPGTYLRLMALGGRISAEVEPGSRILDVGSYDGAIANHVRRRVADLDVTVVDLDESGLAAAGKMGLKTCNASAMDMPFEGASADAVLCLDLIEHVDNDVDLVREISRVLKCGGKLILTTPCANGVIFPFMSKQANEEINRKWGHVRIGYSLEGLEAMLDEVGLKIEKRSGYFNAFTRFAYWLRYLSGWRVPGRDAFYRMIVRLERRLRLKTHEHYLVCRKVEIAAGKGRDAASEGDSEQCQ
ncbi:MAG: hypothetical protein DRP66_03450 [Planctomycetota bacterium]|nr:MAG: hypothetical protein DRP66_03450 [Planctomycetota bacterium]